MSSPSQNANPALTLVPNPDTGDSDRAEAIKLIDNTRRPEDPSAAELFEHDAAIRAWAIEKVRGIRSFKERVGITPKPATQAPEPAKTEPAPPAVTTIPTATTAPVMPSVVKVAVPMGMPAAEAECRRRWRNSGCRHRNGECEARIAAAQAEAKNNSSRPQQPTIRPAYVAPVDPKSQEIRDYAVRLAGTDYANSGIELPIQRTTQTAGEHFCGLPSALACCDKKTLCKRYAVIDGLVYGLCARASAVFYEVNDQQFGWECGRLKSCGDLDRAKSIAEWQRKQRDEKEAPVHTGAGKTARKREKLARQFGDLDKAEAELRARQLETSKQGPPPGSKHESDTKKHGGGGKKKHK